jgi:hypothetical protein
MLIFYYRHLVIVRDTYIQMTHESLPTVLRQYSIPTTSQSHPIAQSNKGLTSGLMFLSANGRNLIVAAAFAFLHMHVHAGSAADHEEVTVVSTSLASLYGNSSECSGSSNTPCLESRFAEDRTIEQYGFN